MIIVRMRTMDVLGMGGILATRLGRQLKNNNIIDNNNDNSSSSNSSSTNNNNKKKNDNVTQRYACYVLARRAQAGEGKGEKGELAFSC